ncbi:hypothetical protein QJQ45_005071 [Haematococcus lacustris]|nr:hypothetical protein QJQ45_005071 [Haematococcus lacustris]
MINGSISSRQANPALAHHQPHSDFDGTPEQQLGLVPRAVACLFDAITARSRGWSSRVTVSFVQLYREQAYDLLNPGSLLGSRGGAAGRAGRGGAGPGVPLRMRWSRDHEFYLENLFRVECSSAAEVMDQYRAGVASKVMASHKLNAASSRSHALLTLTVDSAPLGSPGEAVSAKLTLVDLAGSERQGQTEAAEGSCLRQEGLAINKSLLTLRQVILALASNSTATQAAKTAVAAAGGGGGGAGQGAPGASAPPSQQPALAHVPYRDSKLTALLKHCLGGSGLTTLVACVSPADWAVEDNLSTLEYAARAKKVTNLVAVNEDPKSRLIRELRAEVALLRQQLDSTSPASLLLQLQPQARQLLPSPAGGAVGEAAAGGEVDLSKWMAGPGPQLVRAACQQQGGLGVRQGQGQEQEEGQGQGQEGLQQADGQGMLPQDDGLQGLKLQLMHTTQANVDMLVTKLLNAVALVQQLASSNQALRSAFNAQRAAAAALLADNDTLNCENVALRDKLALLETMALGPGVTAAASGLESSGWAAASSASPLPPSPRRPDSAGVGGFLGEGGGGKWAPRSLASSPAPPRVFTAATSALIELQELRSENAVLHQQLQSAGVGPAAVGPLARASRAGMAGRATPASRSAVGSPHSSAPPSRAARRPNGLSSPGGLAGSPSLRAFESRERGSAHVGVSVGEPRSVQNVTDVGLGPALLARSASQHSVTDSPTEQASPQPAGSRMRPGSQRGIEGTHAIFGMTAGELRTSLQGASHPHSSLSSITHQVASKTMAGRMSTVGHVLPGAAARLGEMAASAPASRGDSVSGAHERALAETTDAHDPVRRLSVLMSARAHLSRNAMLEGIVQSAPAVCRVAGPVFWSVADTIDDGYRQPGPSAA